MNLEDQYLDVLQNIEFGIVQVYRNDPSMPDYDAMRALDALITHYTAQVRKHEPRPHGLSRRETEIFDTVRSITEMRLAGQAGESEEAFPKNSPEEILLCLKRVRKSMDRWNKRSGRQGYLDFVSKYVG